MEKLIGRTILGFVFLMLVLAMALFIPAGGITFWQAWAYLSVFAGCTILITLYLIKNDRELLAGRVKAGPVAEPKRSQQILQSLASLFFIGLFIIPGLDFRFHWSNISAILSLIADGFVVIGFFMVFLVFKENSYTRGTIEVTSGQKVITTGPYHLVRHPMYAGAMLLIIFTPFALGSWVAVPFAIPLILVIIARLLEEEKILVADLGGYKEYQQKVRYRLIPFIW